MRTPTAPHRILRKYYADEAGRQAFVAALFEGAARHYDWGCALGSLGSGRSYRRLVLQRAGLRTGMRLLDVATGTGLVAGAARRILGVSGSVIGLDPSAAMLDAGRATHSALLVRGTAEALPFACERFDFLSMGYALRHVADLGVTFGECARVLKPGGRLLVLEISPPASALGQRVARAYLERILPLVMRLTTGSAQAEQLMRYHWDTIVACVPPDRILDVLRASGFETVSRRVRLGLLSEYVAVKGGRAG